MVWRTRSLAPIAAGLALLAFGAAGSAADHTQRAPTMLSSAAQPASAASATPDCGCTTPTGGNGGSVGGGNHHHHHGGGVGNGGGGGVGEGGGGGNGGGGGQGGFGQGGGGGFGQGGGGGFGQGGTGTGGQGGSGGSILGSFQGGTTVTISGSLVGQLAGSANGNGAGSGNGTASSSALFSGALNTSTNVNALAALNGSAASGGGGGSGFYVDYSTGYIPNLNVEDTSASASSSYQSTRQTVKIMAIQAVCLDDKAVPHPASQVTPDKQVPDAYDGEIFRCIAGARMQFTAAEFNGQVNFDQGQTVTCAKNEALYHTPTGRIECRPQKPARDCNERSLLRRFGAGIKIVKIVWNETYTATREASASSSMGMALDGGVGGVAH